MNKTSQDKRYLTILLIFGFNVYITKIKYPIYGGSFTGTHIKYSGSTVYVKWDKVLLNK